ncbi:hypothetical protein [Clostridium hydrogeniformans]|uniref:hypothetical protein n=1 Tax=Clostridium hydrogeniformans TaxID=349933 RepID=UPI000482D5A9|nr:hypothetical protein [Clostridium hydrogeniformans]
MEVIELIDYLHELVDTAPKVPISGKVVLDKKELLSILDDIVSYLPDELKKAQWVLGEKDRMLSEAKHQYDSMMKECQDIRRKQIESHDITKEAEVRAHDIINKAQREAKEMMIGSRDYADEVLCTLDKEIEEKGRMLLESMKKDMDGYLTSISKDMINSTKIIRENIKELRNIK